MLVPGLEAMEISSCDDLVYPDTSFLVRGVGGIRVTESGGIITGIVCSIAKFGWESSVLSLRCVHRSPLSEHCRGCTVLKRHALYCVVPWGRIEKDDLGGVQAL